MQVARPWSCVLFILCDSRNMCFLLKYGSQKLQLESWNMNQESLNRTLEDGRNCLKYLKRVWNRKQGRGNKDFKKGGGKLGQGVCTWKRGGGSNPLLNYGFTLATHTFLELKNPTFLGRKNKVSTTANMYTIIFVVYLLFCLWAQNITD